jgi:hypothetical protein
MKIGGSCFGAASPADSEGPLPAPIALYTVLNEQRSQASLKFGSGHPNNAMTVFDTFVAFSGQLRFRLLETAWK